MTYVNIILMVQYFKVNSDDIEYCTNRQKEIDICLQKNYENKYIDKIILLLEQDCEIPFSQCNGVKIYKTIIGSRLSYKAAFEYYNQNYSNDICCLLNADIFLDNSIEILKHINFNDFKLFIALNRYEKNELNETPALLNGLELDDSSLYNAGSYLNKFQENIWTQDAWIWKGILPIDERFDFHLGIIGCDNYLVYLMKSNCYHLLNASHLICINHYDHLSINICKQGISKGNVSKKRETRIGNILTYGFLENQDDIPDKYTTKLETYTVRVCPTITKIQFEKSIDEININTSQVITSSRSLFLKPCGILFGESNYWEPLINDVDPYVQINFNNIYEIAIIDIKGKPVDRNDKASGYITKFKITYYDSTNWIIDDHHIYDAIQTSNGNYIKRIYLDKTIKCLKLRIYPIEYVNRPIFKIRLFSIRHPRPNIFHFVCNNKELNKNFLRAHFDYKLLNDKIAEDKIIVSPLNKTKCTKNLLNHPITDGICIIVVVMNRLSHIKRNIYTWLKQNIDQIIIIDWNSKIDFSEFIFSLNDDRILYVRVNNEEHFIRTYAQNLAARLCKFNKICKIDADVMLSENFFNDHPLMPGEFYVGDCCCARNENENYIHGNIYLHLSDFFYVNGYNEYIKSYGYDDTDITIRLLLTGLKSKAFNLNKMYHIPHDDSLRIENSITKTDPKIMTICHRLYLQSLPLWNNNYSTQNYMMDQKNKQYIVCERVKENEYIFNENLYNYYLMTAKNLLSKSSNSATM